MSKVKEFDSVSMLNDKILIWPIPLEDKTTEGGLILPANLKQKEGTPSNWGRVEKVGKDVEQIQPGDEVLLGGFSVQIVEIDEVGYFVCKEESVLVIKKKNKE